MRTHPAGPLLATALAFLTSLPASAENDLVHVVASQDITVSRGDEKPGKEQGIHPKKIDKKEKHQLDRFAMIRFDSEDFGKGVRAAGLRLHPLTFKENETMRFRVYGVLDGDEQNEKFTEKDYDPAAEGTIFDKRMSTMLDRRQVAILGTFVTEKDEPVQFVTSSLLAFIRADTNGTVTLVIIRETDSGSNSTFARRQSETPPTIVMKLDQPTQVPEGEPEPETELEPEPAE